MKNNCTRKLCENDGMSLTFFFHYRKLRPKSVVDVDGPDYCPGNWIVNLLRYFWEVDSIMLTWRSCREKRANMVKFDRWVGAEALLCDCNADNINHLFIFFQIQQIIHQIQFIFPISTKLGFSSALILSSTLWTAFVS